MSRITNRTLLLSENIYVAAIASVKMTNKGQEKRNYETENMMQPFFFFVIVVCFNPLDTGRQWKALWFAQTFKCLVATSTTIKWQECKLQPQTKPYGVLQVLFGFGGIYYGCQKNRSAVDKQIQAAIWALQM